jgi:hypothetical protein
MLKGTKGNKKYIGDAMNTKVFKYYIYIWSKGHWEAWWEEHWGILVEKTQFIHWCNKGRQKKNIMDAKNKWKLNFIL